MAEVLVQCGHFIMTPTQLSRIGYDPGNPSRIRIAICSHLSIFRVVYRASSYLCITILETHRSIMPQ